MKKSRRNSHRYVTPEEEMAGCLIVVALFLIGLIIIIKLYNS